MTSSKQNVWILPTVSGVPIPTLRFAELRKKSVPVVEAMDKTPKKFVIVSKIRHPALLMRGVSGVKTKQLVAGALKSALVMAG